MGTNHKVDIDDKEYTPQEISALILQKLKAEAENYLGATVTKAVITVPAYFTDAQRQATKDAGAHRRPGSAAHHQRADRGAFAYGLDKEDNQTILVFDLGGGTFDVSILEIGDGVFEVKATSGNNRLGGDDFDQRIIDWLVEQFKTDHGIDLTQRPPGDAAAAGGRGKGENRAVGRADDEHQLAVHLDGRRRAAPHRRRR